VNPHKLLRKALSSPTNLRFDEVCALARAFGFHLSRVSGSHHIFFCHADVRELVNLQEVKGEAEPYQNPFLIWASAEVNGRILANQNDIVGRVPRMLVHLMRILAATLTGG
jgi:hypothetical protein